MAKSGPNTQKKANFLPNLYKEIFSLPMPITSPVRIMIMQHYSIYRLHTHSYKIIRAMLPQASYWVVIAN